MENVELMPQYKVCVLGSGAFTVCIILYVERTLRPADFVQSR